jgi:tetratricopeptide (TPR) repeat protein
MPGYFSSFVFCLVFWASLIGIYAQEPPKVPNPKPDYSREAFIVEEDFTKVSFESDGSSSREATARIDIQSNAGLQRYSVLTASYQNSVESVDFEYVRVKKPDGTVVLTPVNEVQDMPAEITRAAPFYSDLREKQVAVKGLSVGDVLELSIHWHSTKPLVPGQFWFVFNFSHDVITLQQQLQITVPSTRHVNWKSPDVKPSIIEEGSRQVFTWKFSQLDTKSSDEQKKDTEERTYQAVRGFLPPPDVQISSFQSWEEVGRWYGALQEDRVKPTPEIRAKAQELTKNTATEEAKVRAIYNYVSTEFRYIGVSFGIGRYQPHAAAEVLGNQYGDCKDKHTLLASLLEATGIHTYPALINSGRDIDPDVPSPGQFDHVITVVVQGRDLQWVDATPEVAPFAYLLTPLRGKRALVIPNDGLPRLITTPAESPVTTRATFRIKATLSDTGTLAGKIERTISGDDSELLLRGAFRRLPQTQWKDLVQQISYGSGFAGDVSDVTTGVPAKIDEPFHFEYSYTRKEYPEWSDRRITAPLPALTLPALPANGAKPSHPIWFGTPGEALLQSSVELPKGYTPELPKSIDLKEDFAEYHSKNAVKDGVLTTERRFIVKLPEVPVAQYEAYSKFSKAVADDRETFIPLSSKNSPAKANSLEDEIWRLPYSEQPEAASAYDEARDLYQRRDTQGEIEALKRAVTIDPKFARAWLWLGQIYFYMRKPESGLDADRKGIEADPQRAVGYKLLATHLVGLDKFEEAIAAWEELIKAIPDDAAGPAGLGSALFAAKRYSEAISAFEAAIKLDPNQAAILVRLGTSHLKAGSEDKALASYKSALSIDSRPMMYNNIGYEMAETEKQLPLALEYAAKAVRDVEDASQKVQLSSIQNEDLGLTNGIAAYWDTLGWVHFRMGHLQLAEKYLKASWDLSQSPVMADHLAQVYEKENKKTEAIHLYKLALAVSSGPLGADTIKSEVRKRLERLGVKAEEPRYGAFPGGDELSQIRTIKLSRLVAENQSADVLLLLGPGPKVEDVKFISGSEAMKATAKTLRSATIQQSFPDDGPTRLVRRGLVSCHSLSGCVLVLLPPSLVTSVN